MTDVIRSGSTIHEDHLDTLHRRTLLKYQLFRQELPEKKHFENADRQTDRQNDKPTDRHVN